MAQTFAPFYVGQKVIAVDAALGSSFKNGESYVISAVEYKLGNPHHPVGRITYYWYVSIVGWADGGAYYRPGIFAPIQEASIMTFTEIKEIETIELLLNN